MKAIVCTKYGPPEVLQLGEIQKPTPGDDEVLVEVQAASVTYSNLTLIKGEPFVGRLMGFGLLKPKQKIPGSDIAGRIEAVGRNIKQFRPGDEVFGHLYQYRGLHGTNLPRFAAGTIAFNDREKETG